MNLHFPYRFDHRGRTRESATPEYIRGLIEQVLFTSPGERVMRPDFGTGLSALLFAPNSAELAATTQVLVQGALTQWLGRLITVDTVEVAAIDSAIQITVGYTIIRSQAREQATFQREGVA